MTNLFDHNGYALSDANGQVAFAKGTTVPSDAATGYITGCIFQKTDGVAGTAIYLNEGTTSSADFNQLVTNSNNVVRSASFALTKANILAMYTTPVEILSAQGAGTAIEFVSATIVYDRATATYGGGGDVSIMFTGGSAISNVVSAANSFGAAGDKVTSCVMLDTANGIPLLSNTGLAITNATGVFTDPGTAAGVGRILVSYRVITTGL